MCDPMIMMSSALAMASTYQQHETAEARAEAQTKLYERNKTNANVALAQQYNDIGLRQQQEQQAAVQDRQALAREARARMATSRVAAGEAGVSGISVEMGLRDISGAAARDTSTVNQNLEWTLGQLQRQKQSARTGAKSRVNSVQPGQKPSSTALGLNLANTALQGYGQYSSTKPKS